MAIDNIATAFTGPALWGPNLWSEAMTAPPPAAVEAAARALWGFGLDISGRALAEAALTAAMPHFREQIAREEAEALAEAWESGLNTGIGFKTAMDILGDAAPEPVNPFIQDAADIIRGAS